MVIIKQFFKSWRLARAYGAGWRKALRVSLRAARRQA